jgi:hypothetical protein
MSSNTSLGFEEQKGIKQIIDGLQQGLFQIMD